MALAMCGCLAPEVRRFDEAAADAGPGDGLGAAALGFDYQNGCVVTQSGAVSCWGPNTDGQLGVPPAERTFASRPVTVPGVSDAVAVDISFGTGCAADAAGAVSCWGNPMLVATGLAGVTAFELSGLNGVAVHDDGGLSRWSNTAAPALVASLDGVVDASIQDGQGCAVAGGEVWCWGGRLAGWLGDGIEDESVTLDPVQAVGINTAAAIVVADRAACAALDDGTVWCWGTGYLTGGTPNPDTCVVGASGPYPCQKLPAPVPGLTGVVELASTGSVICARRGDGSVACWGVDGVGQAGTGATGTYPTPVPMTVIDDAIAMEGGLGSMCMIRDGGAVWCTGGFTGYAEDGFTAVPSLVPVPLAF